MRVAGFVEQDLLCKRQVFVLSNIAGERFAKADQFFNQPAQRAVLALFIVNKSGVVAVMSGTIAVLLFDPCRQLKRQYAASNISVSLIPFAASIRAAMVEMIQQHSWCRRLLSPKKEG